MPPAEWVFEHGVPGSLILLGLVISLAFTVFSAWKYLPRAVVGGMLIGIRFLFLALLFWVLLLPAKKSSITEVVKPRFIVLLDTTGSMTMTADLEPAYKDRWEAAKAVLQTPGMKRLTSQCLVEVYPFQNDLLTPVNLEICRKERYPFRSFKISLSLTMGVKA